MSDENKLKCPLLKEKYVSIDQYKNEDHTEYFRDCIKEECTAWSINDECCMFFTMCRYIRWG